MQLDVTFLIELLKASFWMWTREACERLLQHLGLHETAASAGRRDFRASTGLACSLYSDAKGGPTRIEFPFPLPLDIQSDRGLVIQYVDMTAWPVWEVLGGPTFRGGWSAHGFPQNSNAQFRTHWMLPMATIAVEAQGSNDVTDTVSLVIEPPRPGTSPA